MRWRGGGSAAADVKICCGRTMTISKSLILKGCVKPDVVCIVDEKPSAMP